MRAYIAAAAIAFAATAASAEMRITEWIYDGAGGEFIEFTNIGNSPIYMSGWSFEDNNHPGGGAEYFDLSDFGTVLPGQTVLLVEALADDFRDNWNLDNDIVIVDLLGDSIGHNIGRNDTLHLLDENLNVVDVLRYGDQDFPGSIRTQHASGNPVSPAALGANDPYQWELAFPGDAHGSYMSTAGEFGNPGYYVPEPASLTLLALGALMLRRRG